MKPNEKLPQTVNIPALEINIEGLKRHSFLCLFIPDDSLTLEDRKLRTWLLHTVTTAARHYTKSRELISRQESADQENDGGVIFYIFDVSENIEDCVTAMYRVCMALKRMSSKSIELQDFSSKFSQSIKELTDIRNQFEHMHSQIVAAQTGSGPISISFSDEGRSIRFRNLKMDTMHLHNLIDGAYRAVSTMYPAFNVNSKPEGGGPPKLVISVTFESIEKKT